MKIWDVHGFYRIYCNCRKRSTESWHRHCCYSCLHEVPLLALSSEPTSHLNFQFRCCKLDTCIRKTLCTHLLAHKPYRSKLNTILMIFSLQKTTHKHGQLGAQSYVQFHWNTRHISNYLKARNGWENPETRKNGKKNPKRTSPYSISPTLPPPSSPPRVTPPKHHKNRGGKTSDKWKGPFPSGRRQLHRIMKLKLLEQCQWGSTQHLRLMQSEERPADEQKTHLQQKLKRKWEEAEEQKCRCGLTGRMCTIFLCQWQ